MTEDEKLYVRQLEDFHLLLSVALQNDPVRGHIVHMIIIRYDDYAISLEGPLHEIKKRRGQ